MGQERASKEWEHMNYVVMEDECPPRPDVHKTKKMCFNAQRCIHEGDGVWFHRLHQNYLKGLQAPLNFFGALRRNLTSSCRV